MHIHGVRELCELLRRYTAAKLKYVLCENYYNTSNSELKACH